ncbi:hypothetical protein F5146DRAFT_1228095, partial [Armillaria mellea]
MPSQTFVVLGVEDDHAEIRFNNWQIIDALVLLHCATTLPSSPKPTLLTCLTESTLRAFSEYPKIIIGDPSCERLELSYPENINVVTSVSSELKTQALTLISSSTAAVGEGESLNIILCGHCDIEGKFLIGSGEGVCRQLAKEELQAELWDLVAASQGSDSVVASESDQYRGGIFISALLTEDYSQAGIAMPRPGVTTISEFCASHRVDESCSSCRLNEPLSDPKAQNTDVLVSEMNNFRLSLNRPLYSASFGHHGDRDSIFPFDGPTLLSIAPFTKVKPNPAKSTSFRQSGIQSVQIPHQHHVNVDTEGLEDAPWTLTEEQEMQNLAIAVKQEVLATVPSNLYVMRCALWYLAGGEKRRTVQSIKNKEPLITLRKHEALREQARIIASVMGWDISVDPAMAVGPVDAALIQMACDVGNCDVNVVTFEGKWREPAYWLARLWKAAGGGVVDQSIWDKAVSSAQQQS